MIIKGEVLENEAIRDDLQNMFDRAFYENNSDMLKNAYKNLRKFHRTYNKKPTFKVCNLYRLVESLTIRTDIITESFFKSFIYCGNEIPHIICDVNMIEMAILNIFSNAYLHSEGRLVTVKTLNKFDFVDIIVTSGGAFKFRRSSCDGLDFVKKVCDIHKGRFLIETTSAYTNVHMLLPKIIGDTIENDTLEIREYVDLDRLSPLYVEFFGMD